MKVGRRVTHGQRSETVVEMLPREVLIDLEGEEGPYCA